MARSSAVPSLVVLLLLPLLAHQPSPALAQGTAPAILVNSTLLPEKKCEPFAQLLACGSNSSSSWDPVDGEGAAAACSQACQESLATCGVGTNSSDLLEMLTSLADTACSDKDLLMVAMEQACEVSLTQACTRNVTAPLPPTERHACTDSCIGLLRSPCWSGASLVDLPALIAETAVSNPQLQFCPVVEAANCIEAFPPSSCTLPPQRGPFQDNDPPFPELLPLLLLPSNGEPVDASRLQWACDPPCLADLLDPANGCAGGILGTEARGALSSFCNQQRDLAFCTSAFDAVCSQPDLPWPLSLDTNGTLSGAGGNGTGDQTEPAVSVHRSAVPDPSLKDV